MNRVILLILLSLPVSATCDTAELSDSLTLARLTAGEILVQDSRTDEAGGATRMQLLAHAPAEAIWAVIISCDDAFIFLDGLQSCEVLEETGFYALTHQVVKKGLLVPTQDFVFETRRKPYSRMDFDLVEGNLKAMDGSWEFTHTDAGTLIDYDFRVQTRFPVPRFLIRSTLRRNMPDMLACIRGLAGGSGTAERRQSDLDCCPGAAGARGH